MPFEQRMEIEPDAVVDVVTVERDHFSFANIDASAAQHPQLNGHVNNEDILEPISGFDFTQSPAARRQLLQDVGPDKYILVAKGRLKECRRRSRPEDLASFLQRLADMPMVVPDRVAAGISFAREHAHFVAGIEYRLQAIFRRRCQVTFVTVVPEPQVALIAGKVARLGKAPPWHHLNSLRAE